MASDDFNRADTGANGGWGANWETRTEGTISNTGVQVLSNQAVITASGTLRTQRYTAGTIGNDQYSEVTIVTGTGGDGVTVRDSDGSNFYACYRLGGLGNLRLVSVVAGVSTTLDTQAGAFSDGGVLRLEVSGTSLTCKWNGATVIGPISNSDLSTGRPGIRSLDSTTYDDWSGGDLGGGGGGSTPNRLLLLGVG